MLLYFFLVIPFLKIFLDMSLNISFLEYSGMAVAQIVGLFLKDVFLIVLVISSISNLRPKEFDDTKPIFLVSGLAAIWLIPSLFTLNAPVILSAIRNYIIYPLSFLPAYQFALNSQSKFFSSKNSKFIIFLVLWLNIIFATIEILNIYQSPYLELIGKRGDFRVGDFDVSSGGFISYIELSYFLSISVLGIEVTAPRRYIIGSPFGWLSVLACLLVSFYSQARTGVLTCLLAIFARLYYLKSRIGKALIFILFLLSAMLLWYYIINLDVIVRFSNILEDPRFIFLTSNFLQEFISKPFFGHGLGSFGASATVIFRSQEQFATSDSYYVDSTLLSLLLQTGIVGSSIYCYLIFNTCYHVLTRIKLAYGGKYMGLLLTFIIISILYSAFFPFIDGWPGAIYFFWYPWFCCWTIPSMEN